MSTIEGRISEMREKNKNKAVQTGKLYSADREREEDIQCLRCEAVEEDRVKKAYSKGLADGRMEGFQRGVEWMEAALERWVKGGVKDGS